MEMVKYTNVTKTYFKAHTQLRDVLLFKPKEEFTVLKNLSFSVQKGERLGIIGLNGAGKSTLLKLLSRITPPTSGHIEVNGTVGSLLEVGAGFHPELTGYQNALLNGTILGLSPKEIKRRFKDIIDFSGLNPAYMDIPLSSYSSGMKARLGFSIARLIHTDILILDETLSVGDIAFRSKAEAAIKEMFSQDRTVIFVTHSLDSIVKLASKVLWIEKGELLGHGLPEDIIPLYLEYHKIPNSHKTLANLFPNNKFDSSPVNSIES